MRVLLVGSGGREHALAATLARTAEVITAPGNPGTALIGRNAPVAAGDIDALIELARRESVDLVVSGPEVPLVNGLADACEAAGIACLGPTRSAAMLEASKSFARTMASEAGIPGPRWESFDDRAQALAFVRRRGAPIVIKEDGLAAGKGVVVAQTEAQAEHAVAHARLPLVIEECLEGDEVSLFALCDGTDAILLGAAQDHKRLLDGDEGPNTGGMGAITPPPRLGRAAQEEAIDAFVRPILSVMDRRGTPFRGILFVGLMLTEAGLRLVEYNVRLGDPEAQCLLPLVRADLADALLACTNGRLKEVMWSISEEASCAVVLAASGYPDEPTRGGQIEGIEGAETLANVRIFHAGTSEAGGSLVANGGRVLTVQATGPDLQSARDAAYAGVSRITWSDAVFRRDIGERALRRAAETAPR